MKKTKAFLVIVLVVAILMTMAIQAKAEIRYEYEPEAWQLHRLGLFAGASVHTFNPDLGAPLDRQVGTTLLLNFLGKRTDVEELSSSEVNEILSRYKDEADISPWARPYMAYAVKSGMIVGTSVDTISPTNILDGYSFAAIILRHLGYVVDRNNFTSSLKILTEIGGLNAGEDRLFNKTRLTKNDGVGIIYTVLYATCADGMTLIEKLTDSGHVPLEKAIAYNIIRYVNTDKIELVRTQSNKIKRPTVYDQIYYEIYEALINAQPEITLPSASADFSAQEVFQIIEKCLLENPDILYYSGCTYSTDGTIFFRYHMDVQSTKEHYRKLKLKIEEIIKQTVNPDMTEYEKEKALHDYIVNNCDYDKSGYEQTNISPSSFNAFGALCQGTAVCEGYAEATKLLLNRAGIDCSIVIGTSRGESHAWNIVKIDGDYYHLDTTYNDPVFSNGKSSLVYHYFNLTDDEIGADHQWNKNDYPECNNTKYNYYTYNSLIALEQKDFIKLVTDNVNSGTTDISIKILNKKDFNYKSAVKEACNRLYMSCTAFYNQEIGIVDLKF